MGQKALARFLDEVIKPLGVHANCYLGFEFEGKAECST